MRREGIYSSHLTSWRRQRDAGQFGKTPKKRGPVAVPPDARDQKIVELERSLVRPRRAAIDTSACAPFQKRSRSYSRSRDRENDNPFSESAFKALKYRPDFPERFGSIEDVRAYCVDFFAWYNGEHRHGGIGLNTPEDVRYVRASLRSDRRSQQDHGHPYSEGDTAARTVAAAGASRVS